MFLYIGSRILRGEMPYQNIWDHKPPLIYYLNALASLLTPQSEVGLWVIEVVSLAVSGWLLYRVTLTYLGRMAALFATGLFLGAAGLLLRPGNFTEEFTLPLSFLAVHLYGKLRNPVRRVGVALLLGAVFAAVLLLRPNNIGMVCAIVASLLLGSGPEPVLRARRSNGGYAVLGAALTLLLSGFYFWAKGSGPAMIDAVVRFNSFYIRSGIEQRVDAVIEGFAALAPTGLPFHAVAGWVVAIVVVRRRHEEDVGGLHLLGLVALPTELALIAAAGKGLTHYYLNWLPGLSLLSAIFCMHALRADDGAGARTGNHRLRSLAASALLAAGLLIPARRLLPNFIHLLANGPRDTAALAEEVTAFGQETLLVWGAEVSYNYITGLPSPTVYAYQYPLYVCGYATPEMVETLRRDIEVHRPLIIDTSSSNDRVPSLDPERRAQQPLLAEECALSPAMKDLMGSIHQTYAYAGELPSTGWAVFLPSE